MISQEPTIRVGIVDRTHRVLGRFNGVYAVGGCRVQGSFSLTSDNGDAVLNSESGEVVSRGKEIVCSGGESFTLDEVTIGIGFHWERKERQTFHGDLICRLRDDGTVAVINLVPLEWYLASVISSEMSAESPAEFLKAHAITSRSWLVAMLERERKNIGVSSQRAIQRGSEITRWYDREDHDLYDVCADDHCQRYQGITKIISSTVSDALAATRGTFLIHNNQVCDARFSKSCGGLTEGFESCWEDTPIPYLQSVADAALPHQQIEGEERARAWVQSQPDAYCNLSGEALGGILPSFDRETPDFFRWKVAYRSDELAEIIRTKSGIDFGTLKNLVPVQRGPSGRIVKLRIEGTKTSLTVGKELEIRRWFSKSHLKSSAFVVDMERDRSGIPHRFILHGAGWGHGVGLCQIGAAAMAMHGKKAGEIVRYYFRGAELRKLYA